MSANETLEAIERILFPSRLERVALREASRRRSVMRSPEETNALRAAVRFSDMRATWAGSIGEPGETEGRRMYEQAKVELDETIRALPDDVKARLRGKP
jgi:hypothetical protein